MTPKTETPQSSLAVDIPNTGNGLDMLSRLTTAESEWSDFEDGDLSPGDAFIPVIKMNRKMDGSGGIQLGSDPDDMSDSVEFVWAYRSSSRIHFPGDFNSQTRHDCRSADGEKPDATVADPKSKTCATCPLAWERHGTKETPDGQQVCTKNEEALIYLADTDDQTSIRVARIRFGGLAVKPAKTYWDSFAFRIPKIPSIAVMTKMVLVPEKKEKGTFLVPAFARARMIPRELAKLLDADRKLRKIQWHGELAADLADVTAEDLDDVPADSGPFPEDPITARTADTPNTVGESGTQYDFEGNAVIPNQPEFDVDIDNTAGGYAPADTATF